MPPLMSAVGGSTIGLKTHTNRSDDENTLAEGAKRVPSGQTALLSALETPLAPVLAFIVFTEVPTMATILGGSVVLIAVLMSIRNDE